MISTQHAAVDTYGALAADPYAQTAVGVAERPVGLSPVEEAGVVGHLPNQEGSAYAKEKPHRSPRRGWMTTLRASGRRL